MSRERLPALLVVAKTASAPRALAVATYVYCPRR